MRSRSTPLERFSTFLQFEDDRPGRWISEGRLQRNMQRHLQQIPDDPNILPSSDKTNSNKTDSDKTDRFWALYWHQAWKRQEKDQSLTHQRNLPLDHLNAYLQETCYWVVNRLRSQFTQTQYSLPDCFQIAILRVPKILQGFDSQQGFGLNNYASMLFNTTLRDALRQQQEVDICSNWALLRKTSQKRTIEALAKAGLSQQTIAQHTIAWQCFKTLYVPTQAQGTRSLPPPDDETWAAIVQAYNQQSTVKTDAVKTDAVKTDAAKIDAATIERWLTKTAQAIRNYLNPNTVSLNAPRLGQEEGELQDILTDPESDSLLSELIEAEELDARLEQRSQLGTILQGGIEQCDAESRSILPLYYGQSLTQQEIAAQLNIKQYTVSRRLTRSKELLLKKLVVWSRDDLHISLTSEVMQSMGSLLEDWLQTHYQELQE
jgi:RNA polymerase sigma factor (sigma-70 family)